uniref:Uncharacterized protein n=1 Tax=Candidatus Kentrum sp. DK TaxID=2126562 RepID=A0A450S5N1_9GAMM|nr:MAG: hypothetical protein BECKDK2373B_GA0170837_10169 [Candidatus Kentron sp. DK]
MPNIGHEQRKEETAPPHGGYPETIRHAVSPPPPAAPLLRSAGRGREMPSFSQRWRGKLLPQAADAQPDEGRFGREALAADPRLAYLAARHGL